jgi:hypothetical protein
MKVSASKGIEFPIRFYSRESGGMADALDLGFYPELARWVSIGATGAI